MRGTVPLSDRDAANPLLMPGGPTPLIRSRSLGQLFGRPDVWFKLETGLPGRSWLDRGAAALVSGAVKDRRGGFALVGVDPLALALVPHATRAGLRVVALLPTVRATARAGARCTRADDEDAARPSPSWGGRDATWLAALGGTVISVDADRGTLDAVAGEIAGALGLSVVCPDDPDLRAGIRAVIAEAATQGPTCPIETLAVSALGDHEGAWLAPAQGGTPRLIVAMLAGTGRRPGGDDGVGDETGRLVAGAIAPLADAATGAEARGDGACSGTDGLRAGTQEPRDRQPPRDQRQPRFERPTRDARAGDDVVDARVGPIASSGVQAGLWGTVPDVPPLMPAAPGSNAPAIQTWVIPTREAVAARRLLAREEGIVVSAAGAAAVAGLIRSWRGEPKLTGRRARGAPPPGPTVVLLGDALSDVYDGAPLAPEEQLPRRPLSLAELRAYPSRALVHPPG